MAANPRPKTNAQPPKGKHRNGAGTIVPRMTKTKGLVHDAYCSPKDPRNGMTKRLTKAGFPSEAAAQQWINQTMGDEKAALTVRDKALTVPMLVQEWMDATAEDKVGSTLMNYKSNFQRHFPTKLDIRVTALNKARVKQFIREVGSSSTQGDGRADARTAFNNLRAALRWAMTDEVKLISHNPIQGMTFEYRSKEKIRNAIPLEDAWAILHASMHLPSHLIWRLCMETGARKGEICGLDVGDLNFRDKDAAIFKVSKIATPESHGRRVEARTKNKGDREILLTPELSRDLSVWCEGRSRKAPLFPSPTTRSASGRLGFDTIGRWWHRDCKAAGVDGLGYVPHMLRHTFATEMLGNGEAVNVVSEMLGHSTPTTTMRFYAHTTRAQKKAAMGRARSLLSRPVAGKRAGNSENLVSGDLPS